MITAKVMAEPFDGQLSPMARKGDVIGISSTLSHGCMRTVYRYRFKRGRVVDVLVEDTMDVWTGPGAIRAAADKAVCDYWVQQIIAGCAA